MMRVEKDTLGEIEVPTEALYGAQTARAKANFPISGRGIGRRMIWALGLIKKHAALVNRALGKLDGYIAEAIADAADEVACGDLDDHFPVDLFQTGSGTSSNMNANEVIANRAIQKLGGTVGSKAPVHPNDHVNLGQSSNDVFPTAIHLAALRDIEHGLAPELARLGQCLAALSQRFSDIVKIGRTHLQDAVPLTLGQEFSAFATQVTCGREHVIATSRGLCQLPIGGTAVGTGLNTDPTFGAEMTAALSAETGLELCEAPNHFEAQSARDAAVRASGGLKSLAVSLMKIANDVRWLASGPRLGLGELKLPALQPGSSIMPGKVNPVIAEALIQVGAQVIGNDAAISVGGFHGHFQLNAMQPLIARNLIEQVGLLTAGSAVFTDKLLAGLEPDGERIASLVEQTLGLATGLVPSIGYERAAEIAKQAESEGKTIREVALERAVLSPTELDAALDPRRQTGVSLKTDGGTEGGGRTDESRDESSQTRARK